MLNSGWRPISRVSAHPQQGMTLIELMVVVAIASVLLGLGLPAYRDWAARNKVRVAAESLVTGLVVARNQALQRNGMVHFYLTSNLENSCTLSNTGTSWVVSLDAPNGQCAAAPSDTAAPRIVQKRAGAEGGTSATVTALNSANAAANRLIFTGLGRIQVTTPPNISMNPISTINITYPQHGTCQENGGPVRCLRIQVSPGGEGRVCDPVVTDATDPRAC